MAAVQLGHYDLSYLALEVFTHDLLLQGDSQSSTAADTTINPSIQAAIAFQFLDYPLLLTYAQSSRTSGIASQHQTSNPRSITFRNGKSCVLEEELSRLEEQLEQNPLRVSLLDAHALPRPQLIASGSTTLLVSAPGPLPQHALGSGLPHAAVRSISLYSPDGQLVCTARISCRLTNYGHNPPPLALPSSTAPSARTLQHVPSPQYVAATLNQTWPPAAAARIAQQAHAPHTRTPYIQQQHMAHTNRGEQLQAEIVVQGGQEVHHAQGSPPALYYQNIPGQAITHQPCPDGSSLAGMQLALGHPQSDGELLEDGALWAKGGAEKHSRWMGSPKQAWVTDAASQQPATMPMQLREPGLQQAVQQQQQQQQGSVGWMADSRAYPGTQSGNWDTTSQASRDEFAQAEAAARANLIAATSQDAWQYGTQDDAASTQHMQAQAPRPMSRPPAVKKSAAKARAVAGQKSVPALRAILRSSQTQTHKSHQVSKVVRSAIPPLSLGKALPGQQQQKRGGTVGPSTMQLQSRDATQRPPQHTQVWHAAAAADYLTDAQAGPWLEQKAQLHATGTAGLGKLSGKASAGTASLRRQGSTGADGGSWGIRAAWPESPATHTRPAHMQGSGTQAYTCTAAPASHQLPGYHNMPATASHHPAAMGSNPGAGAKAYPPGSLMHSCMEGGMVGHTMFSQGMPQGPHPSAGMFHMSSVLMWEMMNLVCMRTTLSAAVGSLQNSVSGMATQLVNNACAPAMSLAQQQQVAAAVVAAMQVQAAGGAANTAGMAPTVAPATNTAFMQQQAALASMLGSHQPSIPLPPLNVQWRDDAGHGSTLLQGPSGTQMMQAGSSLPAAHASTVPSAVTLGASTAGANLSPALRLAGAVSEPGPAVAAHMKPALNSKSAAVTRQPSRTQSATSNDVPLMSAQKARSRSSSSVRTEAVPSDSYSADFSLEDARTKSPSVKQGGWVQPQDVRGSTQQSKQPPGSVHTSSVHSYEQDFEEEPSSRPQTAATTPRGNAQQPQPRNSPSQREDIPEEALASSSQTQGRSGGRKPGPRTHRLSSADTMALLASSEDGSSKTSHSSGKGVMRASVKAPSTTQPSPVPTSHPSPAPSLPATNTSATGNAKPLQQARSTRSRQTEAGSSISSSRSGDSSHSHGSASVISSDGALQLTASVTRRHVEFTPGLSSHESHSSGGSRSTHRPLSSRRSRAASEANTEVSFFSTPSSSYEDSGSGSSSGDGIARSEERDTVKSLQGRAAFKAGRMGSKRHSHASRSSSHRRSSSYTVGTSSFNSSDISFSEGSSDDDDDDDDISIAITEEHSNAAHRNLQTRRSLQKRLSQQPTSRRLTHTNRQDSTRSIMMSDITDFDSSSFEIDADEMAEALDDPRDALNKHKMQHAATKTTGHGQVWTNPANNTDSSYLGETADIMEEISNLSSQY